MPCYETDRLSAFSYYTEGLIVLYTQELWSHSSETTWFHCM